MISWSNDVMTPETCYQSKLDPDLRGILPNECQMIKASSGTCSLFLLSSISAVSLELPCNSSATQPNTFLFSSRKLPSADPRPLL